MQNPDIFPARPMAAELDLKAYVQIIWHWAWLIILCTVVAGAVSYGVSIFTVPIYQATTTLLIDQARTPGDQTIQDLTFSERIASTYAEWMKRPETLAKVAARLNVDAAVLDEGITAVTVTPIRDTQMLNVQVEGIWPELLATTANTLPTVFWEQIKTVQNERFAESEANLQKQIDDITDRLNLAQIKIDDIGEARTAAEDIQINRLRNEVSQQQMGLSTLRQSLENLRLAKVQSSDSIVVVEEAKTPIQPVRPRVLTNTLLAAIVGAMLALGLIFLIEYLDDRIKTPEDINRLLDTPILGTIAHIQPNKGNKELAPEQALISMAEPRHPITEAYRGLRTNLQFASIDSTLDRLLITSSTPSEGKTLTAANLAIVMAQAGRKVILIDADLRKPKQHHMFNTPASPGLTEALVYNDAPVHEYLRPTALANLQLLTSGDIPPNPAELLGSQRMQQLLKSLHELADLLVIDAPPLLPVTDSQVLAGQVKGVLLVVHAGKTSRAVLTRAVESLERVQARVLGVVLNNIARTSRGYYYYDQYNYYYASEEKTKIKASQQELTAAVYGGETPKTGEQKNRSAITPLLATNLETNGVYTLRQEKSG